MYMVYMWEIMELDHIPNIGKDSQTNRDPSIIIIDRVLLIMTTI